MRLRRQGAGSQIRPSLYVGGCCQSASMLTALTRNLGHRVIAMEWLAQGAKAANRSVVGRMC